MSSCKNTMILILCLSTTGFFQATPAFAYQQSSTSSEELDAALRQAVEEDEAARERIRATLESDEVRRLARQLGLDEIVLASAAAAVDTLEGDQLLRAASRAGDLEEALSGGVTVTISLVALLLIIIIIILLV